MEPRSSSTRRHNQLLLKLLLLLLFGLSVFFFLNSSTTTKQYQPGKYSHRQGILSALPFPNRALPTKSGYIPITQSSSSIFYAFYEAQNPVSPLPQTPIIIWLQGGPGCSSMYGNFLELGPWRLVNVDHHHHDSSDAKAFELEPNPGAWNNLFGVLFLDNPIGSGFSPAAKADDIPRDHMSIAKHLYIAITRFLDLNATTSFRSRPIFIAGESYAGKYVPAIGYYILKMNTDHDLTHQRQINLGGIAIGNGLIEPVTQVETHASTAFFTGLINEKQKQELEALQSEVTKLVKAERWGEATDARYRVVDELGAMTGLATLFDYNKKRPYNIQAVTEFLNHEAVKRAMRAGEAASFRECSEAVQAALREDTMRSIKYAVEYVRRKKRVLLYQGMYDLLDGVVSTVAWVRTMDLPEGVDGGAREVWRDGEGKLAGYVQRFGNLSNVVVFGAGHLVPVDQPVNARAMIEDWVLGRGLFEDKKNLAVDIGNNSFFSLFD